MRLHIHPENPEARKLHMVSEALEAGGVIIYPTDTVYAIGCDINNKKAIEQLCRIKNIPMKKALFSVVTDSLNSLSKLAKSIDTPVYRFIKSHTPGAYTFILEASREVPHFFNNNRKTIGIRIPDDNVCLAIVSDFGREIVSTTLPIDVTEVEQYTDPDYIYDRMQNQIDVMVDTGPGGTEVSTIIDCTGGGIEIIRQGKGEVDE